MMWQSVESYDIECKDIFIVGRAEAWLSEGVFRSLYSKVVSLLVADSTATLKLHSAGWLRNILWRNTGPKEDQLEALWPFVISDTAAAVVNDRSIQSPMVRVQWQYIQTSSCSLPYRQPSR
jgi:hypothetical protein